MYASHYIYVPHLWFTFACKHHCPTCNALLSKALDSETMPLSEARKSGYDPLIGGDVYPMSPIAKIYTIKFKCKTCETTYGINKLLHIEKNANFN